MANVSDPGVYIEEIPGGARPIKAACTSTAAFVGVTEKGPDGSELGQLSVGQDLRATRITSWQEYQGIFGGFVSEGYLAESVYQFYNNGGRQCYIIRVVGTDPQQQKTASITIANRAAAPTAGVTFYANNTGAWGNGLYLNIEEGQVDSGNTFSVSVYTHVGHAQVPMLRIARRSTPVEVHENLSMDVNSSDYFVERIKQDSKYIEAALDPANVLVDKGYHMGGAAPAETIDAGRKFQLNLNGDGYQEVTLAAGANLKAIRDDIITKVKALTASKRSNSTPDYVFDDFTCEIEEKEAKDSDGNTVTNKHLKLISGTAGADSSVLVCAATDNNAAGLLKVGEAAGGVSYGGLANRRPAVPIESALYQLGDHAPNAVNHVSGVTKGQDDVGSLTLKQYKDAFSHLDKITDVSLLAIPGVPGMFDAGVAYCENRPLRDIFFIGETEITDDEPRKAEAYRKGIAKPNTYGAIYFPWIKSHDPAGGAIPVMLPPSGFIAGLCARIDSTRGVWKAPAGTEATISGATALAVELDDIEQDNLNKIGVNCLRRFDLAGIVCWGACTVYSDPEYKYVPVRRTAIMLRRSIYDGIQWTVFEPNDHRLWSSLRINIGAFMNGLFRAGAFQGEKASDAYFVRCGLGDTMTQGDIDRGQVIALVGFAVLKPAEFVIIRIQQKAGQNQ